LTPVKKIDPMLYRLLFTSLLVLPSAWITGQDSTISLETVAEQDMTRQQDLNLSFPVGSGNNQQQMVGFPLPEPLRVLVTDSAGETVPGCTVYFRTASQPERSTGFTCHPESTVTDTAGMATCKVTLGSVPGPYQVLVQTRGNIGTDTLLFNFEARSKNWMILLISGLLGGLGLFLWGMKLMSMGLQNAAGDRMRGMLGRMTHNRLLALGVGAGVTTIIQSSSATSVMLVGFVQSGLMEFRRTIGIILGAMIGTTFTAQIIAFKITDYALLIIAVGFFIHAFSGKPRMKYLGESVLGFGMLFFGMHVMSEAMYPLRSYAPFLDLLVNMENPLLGILAGTVFTALIQSSSAFIGIMIVLASQGLLSLEASIPLLLGSNLGTAVTAILAGLGSGREGLKVGVAMVMIKFAGILFLVWWIPTFARLVESISPGSGPDLATEAQLAAAVLPRQIANAHTLFSLFLAGLFLPFTNRLARLVDALVPPDRVAEQVRPVTMYLDRRFIVTPSLGLNLAKQEAIRVGNLVREMGYEIILPFTEKSEHPLSSIARKEETVDFLETEIQHYLTALTRENVGTKRVDEAFQIMFVVKEFENIADIITKILVKRARAWLASKAAFSAQGKQELQEFHQHVMNQLNRSMEVFKDLNLERAREMKAKYKQYRLLAMDFEMHHYRRLQDPGSVSGESSETHLELITMLWNMASHATNIARIFLDRLEET
jgi:phosphate:Na+ symporter